MMKVFFLLLSVSALASGPGFSRKPFDRGVLLRETGADITSCLSEPATRVFCEEGFWFRDTFFQWETSPGVVRSWPFPLPVNAIHAVSIGLAIPFRYREMPDSFLYLGRASSYVADGWGFMTAIMSKGKVPPCPANHLQSYCEFGRGRASFFHGGVPQTLAEKTGRAFAEGMHGLPVASPMAEVTGFLRGNRTSIPNLKNCLLSHHMVDCVSINP